jgi:uncharacterized lipoprotein YmbA
MRKFVVIAAMLLASASAQAAGSRGLTLASNDEPAASTQPAPAAAPADVPKYLERPSAVDTKATGQAKAAMKPAIRAEKRPHPTIQARVIYELHRHGIYW